MNARFALSGIVSMIGFAWLSQSCTPTWEAESEMEWPLLGLHQGVPCEGCHTDGLGPLPTACEQCHEPDRPALHSDGPCGRCHTELGWEFAVVDHDPYFPLPHGEGVSSCSSCHVDDGNFEVFSCIDCHEHGRAETDDDHDEVSGYSYSSEACYRCHPNGDD